MTTFQDKQPQSRRALRQEERAERPLADDIDTPTDAETPRVSGRPTGRRARSNFADGLIEVSGADSQESTPLNLPGASGATEPISHPAETTASTAETTSSETTGSETTGSEAAPAWAGPSFGFRSAGFDGSSIPPLAEPDEPSDRADSEQPHAAESDASPLEDIMAATPADDSSVARAFPFAAQVEATSDDDGNQTFLISDFAPDAAHDESAGDDAAPADAEPTDADVQSAGSDTAADSTIPVGEPIPVAEPVAPVDPVVVEPEERTMTRREWRAWRAQQEAAGNPDGETPAAEQPSAPVEQAIDPTPVFIAPVPATEPAAEQSRAQADIPQLVEPQAEPAAALSDAMAEFEALTRGSKTASGPVEIQKAPATAPANDEPDPIVPAFPLPASAASTPAPATSVASVFSVPAFTAPVPPEVAPPAAEEPVAPAATNEPAATKPAAADAEESAYVPPVGHWSRQAALDDESQPLENTLSRDVGGGNVATTTNALVLPMIPQRDDFSSMINSTGEIMVTGTIDLPMSVGATGRDSRHYDDPEVDHLFDAFDNEVATTDSAPVRAITAVSSHTATRSGIESTRKQGNRMLTVLIVTACVMAVGVVGLLVAGFVFDIFQA